VRVNSAALSDARGLKFQDQEDLSESFMQLERSPSWKREKEQIVQEELNVLKTMQQSKDL